MLGLALSVSAAAFPAGSSAHASAPSTLGSDQTSPSIATSPAVSTSASVSPNPTDAGFATGFSQTSSGCLVAASYTWTWGDGTASSSSASATHTFVRPGTYEVTAWANCSVVGGGATDVLTVQVNPPLTVEAKASRASEDVGGVVSFQAASSGGTAPVSYNWTLGNGGRSELSDPTASFSTVGTKVDQVWANDSVGESAHAYGNVTVNPDPKVTIAANTTLSAGEVGNFSATVSGGTAPFTYRWALGNGSFSNSSKTTHAFLSPGTRTVWVWANDSIGFSASSSVQVSVAAGIAAIPSASSDPTSPGATVDFQGQAQGGQSPYDFAWAFGDGSFSSSQDPPHAFATDGVYVVRFWANDSGGNSAHGSLIEYVETPLTAHASASPGLTDAGTPVQLQVAPSGGVAPYTETWRFGDGEVATGVSVLHTFEFAGTYAPEVWVNDSEGGSALVSTAVTVDPALVIRAGAGSPYTDAGTPVPFVANATGGAPPIQYAWHLSDGYQATGPSIERTFTEPATVTVTAWANDSAGVSVNSSFQVDIALALAAEPVSNTTSTHVGQTVNLTGRFVGGTGPFSFLWTFGDGTLSTDQDYNKSYANPGAYTLWFWVNDSVGGSSRGALTVTVLAVSSGPSPNPSANPSSSGLPWWVVALVVVVVLAAVVATVLYVRQRRGAAPVVAMAGEEGPAPPHTPQVEFLPKQEADFTGAGLDLPPWPATPFTIIESVDPTVLYRTAVRAHIDPESLFVLTLQEPAVLEESYGLKGATILQVSRLEGDRRISPGEIDRIAHNAEIHLGEAPGRAVLVDATESFLSATSLSTTARFFHVLQEAAERNNGRLIAYLNPREVTLQERRSLEEGATRIRIGPKSRSSSSTTPSSS